jgi:hypothetical protein
MRRRQWTLIGVCAVASIAACSDSKAPPSARSSAFNPFATASSSGEPGPPAPPATLAVGDCFNTDRFAPGTSIDLQSVHLVACTDAHHHEVYAVARHPARAGTPYPGDDAMAAFADDQCLAAYASALGVDYRKSTLDFAVVKPDTASWKQGERSVVCTVHDTNFAELTGSVRAATSALTPTSTSTTSVAAKSG